MPAQQRTTTAVEAAGRPGWPQHGGVPSWGAVLIAVVSTLAGFAIEAGLGHSELGSTFAVFYALGCLAAVLAVRQAGVFTAVIQPPLVLFVAVPTAYFLLHGSAFAGLKDILITCGYPLIERFPLMLLTTGGVLLIGLIRWYLTQSGHTVTAGTRQGPAAEGGGQVSAMAAKLAAFFTRPERTARRPRHGVDRRGARQRADRRGAHPRGVDPRGADRDARSARPAVRRAPAEHSREGRAARDRQRRRVTDREDFPSAAPRPRRRTARRPVDVDPGDRPRRTPGYRGQDTGDRDTRRRTPPPHRREPWDPPPSRERRAYQPHQPYEPYPDPYPPRRRPATNGADGRTTHHPVSRVRYRGSPDDATDGGRPRR